ncbi:MAG: hypothetical protein GF381_02305 [Candidatus Pacebacteria bacterium]|nr:hypothetical protein [Candidatus Paceibacterota bacterium]
MVKTQIQIPEKMETNEIKRVAFFGSADVAQEDQVCQEVFKAAQTLARKKKVIVNGGGPGVMEAATRGAESVEGETVAITFYPEDMPEFEGRDSNNQVDVEIKTANYIERMYGLIYYSDLFICFQGGTGTLSEWSTAWLLAHLYYGHHKPLILFGDFWHEVMEVIGKHFFIGDKEKRVYKIVTTQEELSDAIDQFEAELKQRG